MAPISGWAESRDEGEIVVEDPRDGEATPPVPCPREGPSLPEARTPAGRWVVWINGIPEFTGPEHIARDYYEAALLKSTTKSGSIQEERTR